MPRKQVDVVELSSVTAKGFRHRTTIPHEIFARKKLKDKDRLRWILYKDGTIEVEVSSEKVEGR